MGRFVFVVGVVVALAGCSSSSATEEAMKQDQACTDLGGTVGDTPDGGTACCTNPTYDAGVFTPGRCIPLN